LLATQTASASATLDFTGFVSASYDVYIFELINIVPSTDASLLMRVSTDGGASYDSGANYVNATWQANQGATDGTLNGGTTDTEILIANSVEATSNNVGGTVKLFNPASATHYKVVTGSNTTMKSDGNFYSTLVSGRYTSVTAVNAVRFLFASGNIASGTIRIYGLSKTIGAGVPSAMVLLETQTPSGTGTVTFSSLGSYTHLLLVANGRSTEVSAASTVAVRFNGDTAANYDRQVTVATNVTNGAGANVAATSAIFAQFPAASATAGRSGMAQLMIPDYRGTTFHKSGVAPGGLFYGTTTADLQVNTTAINWRSTAAITSMTVFLGGGNYVAGTTLSLYGLT
jgi:hypothetical protein